METHTKILKGRIPCTEEPGGLQSNHLQRVRHDRAIKHTYVISYMWTLKMKQTSEYKTNKPKKKKKDSQI